MSKELNSNKLNGKDLINAGIFSAIYVVIIMLVACTVGMIPIGFILLTLLVPLLEGIPMMLYFAKIKKVGMIMILQVVIGLAMIITGMGYDLLIWGIVTGIIAEIIMKVMFRFFPTIKEEYRNVQDAMKLRGVGSVRDPMKMLEYRMVPFLMSVVSIGNDLSASALTRALNSPNRRTNVCNIGFTWRDVITFIGIFFFFSLYFSIMLWQGGTV